MRYGRPVVTSIAGGIAVLLVACGGSTDTLFDRSLSPVSGDGQPSDAGVVTSKDSPDAGEVHSGDRPDSGMSNPDRWPDGSVWGNQGTCENDPSAPGCTRGGSTWSPSDGGDDDHGTDGGTDHDNDGGSGSCGGQHHGGD